MPDLVVSDLTIEYSSGGYAARPVDGLHLTAPAGSLTLLLGPSGCGKTSLLSCLGGILKPTAGSIRFGDIDVGTLKGKELTEYRRQVVGIVFQSFNLIASLSALENVVVPLSATGVKWNTARTRAEQLLESVGLQHRTQHRPGDLSGGQQQRVAIARALALSPSLILADEPTAHLDYLQVEEVLKVLRTLASGGRVVVVATHDQRLLSLADHVVELVPDVGRSSEPPQTVRISAGDVLFEQGSWGELIYVVQDGEVDIVARRSDGSEEPLNVVGPGGYFGEMGPMFSLPRSATAWARTDATLVGYNSRDFRQLTTSGGVRATAQSEDLPGHTE